MCVKHCARGFTGATIAASLAAKHASIAANYREDYWARGFTAAISHDDAWFKQ